MVPFEAFSIEPPQSSKRLLQRMRRRHPVRQAQLEGLVLSRCGGGAQGQGRTERGSADCHEVSSLMAGSCADR
jgi:hypothetical protein